MKVKSLLKTLEGVQYCLMSETGRQLERAYVSSALGYDETSNYEDYKVVKIETINNCDELFITIKWGENMTIRKGVKVRYILKDKVFTVIKKSYNSISIYAPVEYSKGVVHTERCYRSICDFEVVK